MKINYKTCIFIIVVVALIVVLACARYLAIENNKISNELTTVQNELNLINGELSTTENELISTQESLTKEIKKSTSLEEMIEKSKIELESANTTIADLKSEEYEFVYMGDFRYTYYCDERYEHICGYGLGLTASGKPTEVGRTVAADTSVLPMGSIIYVEGIGFREVMDRGGGVNGKHIDILMTTHNECFKQTIINGGVWVLVKKS